MVASGVGGEKTLVPSVVGYGLKEAERILLESSLNLGAVICQDCKTTDDTLVLSKVWKQRPVWDEESLVDLGSYVDIWLTTDTSKIVEPIRRVGTVKENEGNEE